MAWVQHIFLSTPSARRATGISFADVQQQPISIHALREEGDQYTSAGASARAEFLSTPSARRATGLFHHRFANLFNFYPRPPRGGRRWQSRRDRRHA